jgi:hypothetical protein
MQRIQPLDTRTHDPDIAAQLSQRYPDLFNPLIEVYQTSTPHSKIQKKYHRMIESLLERDGEMIELSNQGLSFQDIGNRQGLTRERIRQIINKYEGYYIVAGSTEWCLTELDKIVTLREGKKVLPSNEELDRHHGKLAGYLRQHFSESKTFGKLKEKDRLEIVKKLRFDIQAEVKNHTTWSEERLIYEIKELAEQLGKPDLMPMQKEISQFGTPGLRSKISRFGGQSKVAQLAGLTYQGQTVGSRSVE